MSAESIEQPIQLNITHLDSIREERIVLVDFDGEDDPEHPHNWSKWSKWTLVVLISAISLTVNLAILMTAPATPAIMHEFHSSDSFEGTILVSIWELGEVVGPLVLAPLSEVYGRLPVYHSATALFVIFALMASFSTSMAMLIALRFALGMSVASSTLNSCMVGDMFKVEQHGRALSIMGIIPYLAPCLGPAAGGFLSDRLGWRWTFRVVAIVTGGLQLGLLFALRESYCVVILDRKARRLRAESGNQHLRGRYSSSEKRGRVLGKSFIRPFQLFFASPAIPMVAICGSIAMGYSYVVVTSLTGILENVYSLSASQAGLGYLGLGVGMVTGILLTGAYIDFQARRSARNGVSSDAEHRVAFPLITGYFLVALGLLAVGWTAQDVAAYIAPILACVPVGLGFTAVTLASWSYLIDAFGIYAASATTSVIVVRNAASTVLPLAAPPLMAQLGHGWGFTVLFAVAILFSPVPFILVAYGGRCRSRGRCIGSG